jgi:predicted nucleic acid-binding protein
MSDPSRTLVIDTSVLINFIVVERLDLLTALPGTVCVVTDHVRGEITDDYPGQVALLLNAIEQGSIKLLRVDSPEELQTFADLEASGLGAGERSAFAAARHRGCVVAIDDRRAIRIASRSLGDFSIVRTEDIVRESITAGIVSVAEADAFKHRWEALHRFRLPFESFGDPT